MPARYIIGTVLVISFLGMLAAVASLEVPSSEWTPLAPGIDYRRFTLPDPNNVFVARLDRYSQAAIIDSILAQGSLGAGLESISRMTARTSDALTNWSDSGSSSTPGMRGMPVAAINGAYFDWETSLPQGGQVQSGWYLQRYQDMGGWSGFAWTLDRQAFIGECVRHLPERQVIAFPAAGDLLTIDGVNRSRRAGELILYTPQYASRTPPTNDGLEVVIGMSRPALIMPLPAYAAGTVLEVRSAQGNTPLYFDQVVLSASGSTAQALAGLAQPGGEVRISQEITSYLADCHTPTPVSWDKTYASVQGAFLYLRGGMIQGFFDDPGAANRHPRTAVALNERYVFFIVVDGRNARDSIGMTIEELALFSRDTLGAAWGVAQDGGGSSTLVINGRVVNNTYCNNFTCTAQFITRPVDKAGTPPGPQKSTTPGAPSPLRERYERPVANGLVMLALQPPSFSFRYTPGIDISAGQALSLYAGPGDNFASLASIPAGTSGVVLEHPNGLNGISARGDTWWRVDFGGQTGWAAESALAPSP
jgi:hypothetical protein